jgi:hypothetical protein
MTSLACFPTEDLLTVRVTGGDVVRVTVAGELDAFTAPQLGRRCSAPPPARSSWIWPA